MFPLPLADAAAWDAQLTYRTARAAAVEATASGVHWTYAPMVDIARDPRWGRVAEGAGEDPFLGSILAAARVRGFHGAGPPDISYMMATAKHFIAYGAGEGGRDYNVADLSERTVREVHLPPFRAAVAAGVDAIMPAFSEFAATPMHSNKALLTGLLRQQEGFTGIIVSDYIAVRELIQHGIARTEADASLLALNAGVDVEMASQTYRQNLPTLAHNNQVSLTQVDDAVRRILKAKQRLGLFDDPYRYSDAIRETNNVLTPQHRALAREAGQKFIVLLKNNRSVGQIPIYYAHKNTCRPNSNADGLPDIFSSNYMDINQAPAYPFGFGLSYTTFAYSMPRLSTQRLASNQSLTVEVTVTNTGKRAGDEIVQLYLRDDVASVTRPVRQLRGFHTVHLAPGEAQSVTFTLDQKDFALLDMNLSPMVEAGTFTVFVGADSTATHQAQFEVTDSRQLSIAGQSVPPVQPN